MNEQNMSSETSIKSLVNWKKAPTLENLKQDLADAKPIHDAQVSKINEYLDNLAGTGKAKVRVAKGNSSIVPKLIRKQAEWRYAALSEPFLSSEDIFDVQPVSWEDRKAAQQNGLVLNSQFSTKIDKVSFIDEYVRTAVDEGTAIVQVGWNFDEIEEDVEVPDVEYRVNPELAPLHEHLEQMKTESPSEYATDVPEELKTAHDMSMEGGEPIEPVILGYKTEKQMKITKNCPTLEVRNSKNVVIDPTCEGDFKRAKFVIYSFESSLSELKKDRKYKNLDRINLNTNNILGTPDHEIGNRLEVQSFNFKDKPRQKFVVYEYWGFWDIDGSRILEPIVAAWVGDTVIRMEKNPFPDKALPFVVTKYLPIRRSVYGEPDGALLEDNQRVVGAITRGMIDILGKSANGQTGMRKDMLDQTNRRKYDAGMDYEFNQNVDPRVGVYMHTFPEIPNSAQFMLNMQNLEAEAMTGVKAFNQGIGSQSLGDVAAGIRGALDAASKRELGILRRLANGMVEIGRKVIAMNAEFLSEEEIVRLTNEEFVTVKKDDLSGDFDLSLTISTPEEDNNKAEQLAFMLQTVGPNEDPMVRRMILADICKLRKMPDLAKKIESYEPEPDPMVQERMQLEIELLKSQIAENTARASKYDAGAQLDGTKMGTEQAKAGHLKSTADKTDLDFVEQESGVKQERDLQKQGAQAEAQTKMKVTEHALNVQRDDKKQETDLLKEYLKQGKK